MFKFDFIMLKSIMLIPVLLVVTTMGCINSTNSEKEVYHKAWVKITYLSHDNEGLLSRSKVFDSEKRMQKLKKLIQELKANAKDHDGFIIRMLPTYFLEFHENNTVTRIQIRDGRIISFMNNESPMDLKKTKRVFSDKLFKLTNPWLNR